MRYVAIEFYAPARILHAVRHSCPSGASNYIINSFAPGARSVTILGDRSRETAVCLKISTNQSPASRLQSTRRCVRINPQKREDEATTWITQRKPPERFSFAQQSRTQNHIYAYSSTLPLISAYSCMIFIDRQFSVSRFRGQLLNCSMIARNRIGYFCRRWSRTKETTRRNRRRRDGNERTTVVGGEKNVANGSSRHLRGNTEALVKIMRGSFVASDSDSSTRGR